jgi:enolase
MFALETAILKALAAERGEQLWKVINPKARKLPYPVGNCVEGGLHSNKRKKPDFQEFLMIPKTNNFSDNVFLMRHAWKRCGEELKVRKKQGGMSDENAWSTSLSNEEVLEIMKKVKEELEGEVGERIDIGIDLASSTFYTGLIYYYKNKKKRLTRSKQISYVLDLIDEYNIDYIEDPLQQEDFSGFRDLKSRAVRIRPTCIIVGDDLTVSNIERVKKALKTKAINAIILKPNQIGSLTEIADIVILAKKNNIKTVMSHRSGETQDYALADLAFAFQTDYIKTGIMGKEREVKLRRLVEIEKESIKKSL